MSSSGSIPSPPLPTNPSTCPAAPKPSLKGLNLPRHQKRPATTQDQDSAAGVVKWDERKLVGTVDYDRGERRAKMQVVGVGRDAIPARYRLRVDATRFQKDWKVSEVVERVMRLRHWGDIDAVLNSWIGRFSRKNFSLLIREITATGSLEHAVQVFHWMKNQKNYCARSDIYNMMIRLHARHNRTDQARALFFEMREWRYTCQYY